MGCGRLNGIILSLVITVTIKDVTKALLPPTKHNRKKNVMKCSEKLATSKWLTWPTTSQLKFARNLSSRIVPQNLENPFAQQSISLNVGTRKSHMRLKMM